MLSFLRHGVDADGNPTVLACIANFSGGPHDDYRVGLPFAGRWVEVLNTDAEIYGGSGVGNFGAVEAEPVMWHGRPASAALRLPPQGVLWLAPERAPVDEIGAEAAADIGQSAPVGDTASAAGVGAPVSPTAGAVDHTDRASEPATASDSTEMPELSSGDGTIVGGIDQAYAADDAAVDSVDPVDSPGAEQPAWAGGEATGAGAPRNTDEPQFPDEAPAEAVQYHEELLDPALDTAPSAGVSADAPVVAPEVPQVEESPLGTGPEEVPADVAQEDEPPVLEETPDAPDAVLDEPRFASDVAERPVAVGGSPEALEAATPSATRSPLDADPDSAAPSSTHQ